MTVSFIEKCFDKFFVFIFAMKIDGLKRRYGGRDIDVATTKGLLGRFTAEQIREKAKYIKNIKN